MGALIESVKNDMLDAVFKDVSPYTFDFGIYDDSDVLIDTVSAKTFTTASGGVTSLSSAMIFTIPAGTTVHRLEGALGANLVLSVDLDNETFSANGTYTVSNITVSL